MSPSWIDPVSFARGLGPRVMQALAALRGSQLGLRTHLIVFGLAIVIPVLLFSAFLLSRYTAAERAANERRALEVARGLSADIDREIKNIITILQTLATSSSLASRDFAAFHAQAKEALGPRRWNVVLIGPDRRQLVNTRLPWGAPLPVNTTAGPDVMAMIRQAGKPHISELFMGPVAQRWVYSVSVPVVVDGEMAYALVMSLEPDLLIDILKSESLPEGWIAAVADARNINMARTRAPERFVGQPVPEQSVRQYTGKSEGVINTKDLESRASLQGFHYSGLTGWRTAAWAPRDVVEAPLREAWWIFLYAGASLLGLSLLLAYGVGRLMAEPMSALMRAGAALGAGKQVVPITSTLREADELSRVLANAARELEARMGAQAQLAAIVSSSPSAVVSLSPRGIIRTWNSAAVDLFGYQPSEVIGRSVEIFYPQDGRDDFAALNARILAGEAVQADVLRKHKDGRLIDVSINVAPMYDDADRMVGISAIVRDITQRKERERHIQFLMRELSHRSKNLLAVIQAIAGQTARNSTSMPDFQARFSQRLAAIAQSQDLLVAQNWKAVDLRELVRALLAPFIDGTADRITVQGPELRLKPDAVHNVTLAVHELATNAAKYGALSAPGGQVAVSWDIDPGEGDGHRLHIHWRERGGPPVKTPERQGFGRLVIAEMVASSLRGEVKLDFAPTGLCWSLDIPARNAMAPADTAVAGGDLYRP